MKTPAPGRLLACYAEQLCAAIEAVVRDEAEAVSMAAALVAVQLRRDGLVYVYGPGGHSALAVQDVFYRAGCPINIAPVVDPATMLINGALRSTSVERTDGHGAAVVAESGVGSGDPFVIVNAFGVNATALSAAKAARARGARVIALSSPAAVTGLPPEHPARAHAAADLSRLADVHVDTHVPAADVVLDLGRGVHTGRISTALNSFVLHAILASAVEQFMAADGWVWVWRWSYTPGGDIYNQLAAKRVRDRVSQL